MRTLTNNFFGSQAYVFIWAVEEGQFGYWSRSHIYLLFNLRVDADLTVGVRI